jgi:SHS2 domain-containing protein
VKNYELIEHTADIGIRVKSRDLEGLFKDAAIAMFEIIAEEKSNIKYKKSKIEKIIVRQDAETKEELFVNWLNELLSLSAVKELVFSNFVIKKLTEKSIEAVASGEDASDYKVNVEIKAATYHQLKLERSKTGWMAEVIFEPIWSDSEINQEIILPGAATVSGQNTVRLRAGSFLGRETETSSHFIMRHATRQATFSLSDRTVNPGDQLTLSWEASAELIGIVPEIYVDGHRTADPRSCPVRRPADWSFP